MSRKVRMNGMQRSEFLIWEHIGIKIQVLTPVAYWLKIGTRKAGDLGSSTSEYQIFHFFCAALAKRLKVQFRQGFAYISKNVDSKRHIIIRTAILYNEINSGQIMKKTLSNKMSKKVHMKWMQRSEFKIWKLICIKIQVLPLTTVA